MKNIVIIGGGFTGAKCAKNLENNLVEATYQITIDIQIKDKIFKRTFDMTITWQAIIERPAKSSFWGYFATGVGGTILGIVIGILIIL